MTDGIGRKIRDLRELAGPTAVELQPPAALETVEQIERALGAKLPADYRAFVLEHGNGGSGPDYGLVPIGTDLDYALPDGALLLAEIGCGYFYYLVVRGPRAGEVWCDTTAADEDGGIERVAGSFTEWYEAWLDDHLRAALATAVRASSPPHALIERYEAIVKPDRLATVLLRIELDLYLGRRDNAQGTLNEAERTYDARQLEPALRLVFAEPLRIAEGTDVEQLRSTASFPAQIVREAVARNAVTPDSILSTLARDHAVTVRRAVAEHPNASPTTLDEIVCTTDRVDSAADFVALEAVARHPACASSTTLVARDEVYVTRAVARGAAPDLATYLARSPHPAVRHMLALNAALPRALVTTLANDRDRYVRMAVAARIDLPADLIGALALDDAEEVRAMIARHPQLSTAIACRLAGDLSRTVIFALSSRDVPAPALELLQAHPHYSRETQRLDLFARWPRSNTQIYSRLDATAAEVYGDGHYKGAVLSHPSFPLPFAPPLIEEQYGMGGFELAAHPWLSVDLIERLGSHSYDYTRKRIAEREDSPPSVVDRLARDPKPMVRLVVAARRDVSRSLYDLLSTDDDPAVRDALAGSEFATETVLTTALVRAEHAWQRVQLLSAPNLTDALFVRLATDDDAGVRVFAAMSPRSHLVPDLLRDPDPRVRLFARANVRS